MKCFIIALVLGITLLLVSCGGHVDETAPKQSPSAADPVADAEVHTDEQNEHGGNHSDYFILPYDFTAVDLYGNTVTAQTLGEKRVFFVHLWATWCGPCVRGMPDLAELSRNYADDVGFIGLVVDFDNTDGAINIIEESEVPDWFVMIDMNEPSAARLLEIVRTGFVPSTALITKDNQNPEPLTNRDYTIHLDKILGG